MKINSLEQRSKGPADINPLDRWKLIARDIHGCCLMLESAGEERYFLTISLKTALRDTWLVELKTTFPDYDTHKGKEEKHGSATLDVQEDDGAFTLSGAHSHFFVDRKKQSFYLQDKEGGTRLFELLGRHNLELSVGTIEQAYGIFSHKKKGIGLSYEISPGEKFFGAGEDFGSLVKNSRMIHFVNSDALGVGGGERYQSTPCFYSSNGYLMAVLSDAPCSAAISYTRQDIFTLTSWDEELSLVLVPDVLPKRAIHSFRNKFAPPKNAPDWSQGLWLSKCYYQDQEEVEKVIQDAREHEIDFHVINLDARTWMRADTRTDFIWDTSRFDSFTSYIPSLRARGIHVSLWENPYVSSKSEIFAEACAKGFFAKDKEGEPYLFHWIPQGLSGFPPSPKAAIVDFTLPEARTWWKGLHLPYIEAGVTCFKTDFGEEIPFDAQFANGKNGWQMRNRYADLYNLCVYSVLEEQLEHEGMLWARSGHLQLGAYPLKWGGDSQTSWRALRASLRGGLSQSVCGALFWSHDAGGFYGEKPDDELYLRWLQMALWGSHARCHGTTAREPWAYSQKVLAVARIAIQIRSLLKPYFISEFKKSCSSGVSFLSPLWLQHAQDQQCQTIDDQFYAGSDVIVAPFLSAHGGRRIYLPAGRWCDLRDGREFEGPLWVDSARSTFLPCFFNKKSEFSDLFKQCVALQK